MEITLIHGQAHKGSTYNISSMVKEKLSNNNTVVHEYFMLKDAPSYCVGCFNCIFKDELKCPESEKVQKILSSMLTSDIIIIDSPTYCMEMTGQLKTLFDHFGYIWMSHRPRKEMFSKIGIVVSTAAGAGSKRVSKSIKNQMFWWGVPQIYTLNLNVNASSWDEAFESMKNKIQEKVEKVSLKAKNNIDKEKFNIKTVVLFNIMRKMHSNNTWNETDKNYWDKNYLDKKTRPWRLGFGK